MWIIVKIFMMKKCLFSGRTFSNVVWFDRWYGKYEILEQINGKYLIWLINMKYDDNWMLLESSNFYFCLLVNEDNGSAFFVNS